MKTRIQQLQEILSLKKLDVLLVSNFYNILYLSGFSGVDPTHREAFLLVTQRNVYLLTNALYIEEAQKQFSIRNFQFSIKELNQEHKLASRILEIAKQENLKQIGFEQYDLTYAEVEKLKKELTLKPTEKLVEDLRMIKDESEIESIKKACALTDETFAFIIKKLKVGVTEQQIAWEIEKYIRENGGQLAFSPIVAFGTNNSMPHYKLTENSQLQTADSVLLDFGARIDGYCADMSRVVFMGKPTDQQRKMYDAVLKAQEKAFSVMLNSFQHQKSPVIPKPVRDDNSLNGAILDKNARDIIKKDGFPPYPHSLGHGVGLEIHEGFRLTYKKDFALKPGMVFSIEPGIYIPMFGGVRIEDLVLLKKDGIEILSKSPKEFIIL